MIQLMLLISRNFSKNILEISGKLKEADEKAVEYRNVLDQQQAELDDLKVRLQAKDKAFDDMKSETDVYKQQYEGLLEEYQQYLQDLETLQVKSDNLEKWKSIYESEIAELKNAAVKQDEALEEANEKIVELNKAGDEKQKLLQKMNDLEASLSREKTTVR